MRTNAFIICFLTVAQIGAFQLKSNAQHPNRMNYVKTVKGCTIKEGTPVLIADETTLTYHRKEAIIECDNEAIFKKLRASHSQLFQWDRCTVDIQGHKHYVIHLNKQDADIVYKWAKNNL